MGSARIGWTPSPSIQGEKCQKTKQTKQTKKAINSLVLLFSFIFKFLLESSVVIFIIL